MACRAIPLPAEMQVTCERPGASGIGEEPGRARGRLWALAVMPQSAVSGVRGGCSVRMGIEGLRRSPFGEVAASSLRQMLCIAVDVAECECTGHIPQKPGACKSFLEA